MLFNKIVVEKKFARHPLVIKLKSEFSKIPLKIIDRMNDFSKTSKKTLWLTEQKGRFLIDCPGTPRYVCCGYRIIENSANCPFDCSYCYLQTYLNRPFLRYYLNDKKMLAELKGFLKQNHGQYFRFGTGELADSLALDEYLNQAEKLIVFFAGQKTALLELKTKSARIQHILKIKHGGQTVLAWSLNPEKIIRSEENGAASLKSRLSAAAAAAAAGFPVAFHFDPLIIFPGWEKAYAGVVRKIYRSVQPGQIAWISLGSLRFVPAFKEIFKMRFPRKKLLLEEFITGTDGKNRYFKPLRIQMYQELLKNIRSHDRKTLVYLCMESPGVWQQVFDRAEKIILNASPYRKYFSFKLKTTPRKLLS